MESPMPKEFDAIFEEEPGLKHREYVAMRWEILVEVLEQLCYTKATAAVAKGYSYPQFRKMVDNVTAMSVVALTPQEKAEHEQMVKNAKESW